MVVHTEKRKISEIRKGINKLNDDRISIIPNIKLEELVESNQTRIFVNQLIAMTTDMSERKNYKIAILLSYSGKRLSKAKERKLENIIEQMTHQLEFTNVMLLINVPTNIPLDDVKISTMINTENLSFASADLGSKDSWKNVM